jgi:hypothetical protein
MQGHARPKMPQTAIGSEMEHNERTYSGEICEKLACLYLWPKLAPDVCLSTVVQRCVKDVSKICKVCRFNLGLAFDGGVEFPFPLRIAVAHAGFTENHKVAAPWPSSLKPQFFNSLSNSTFNPNTTQPQNPQSTSLNQY